MRFLKDLTWVRQVFKPQAPDTPLVSDLSEIISLVADAYGSHRYAELRVDSAGQAGPTNEVQSSNGAVPPNMVRFIPFAHVRHNDPVARTIWLAVRIPFGATNFDIQVGDANYSASTDRTLGLGRPIVLPPGSQLFGKSRTGEAIAITFTFTLEHSWIDIPIGENVRY